MTARYLPEALHFGMAVLLAAVCGLLSKPMLVTLPCVLLLLDYWRLRAIFDGRTDQTWATGLGGVDSGEDPLFCGGGGGSGATVDAHNSTWQSMISWIIRSRSDWPTPW